MTARFSAGQLPAAAELAAAADQLRGRLAALASQDAAAYQAVLAAYALPREPDAAQRRQQIRAALHGAVLVPLAIAEASAQVARLAVTAAGGNPNLRGDTVTAACLAEAAARSAAALVDINVRLGSLPAGLSQRAAAAVTAAGTARESISPETA